MEERNTLLIVDDFEFNRLMLSDTFRTRISCAQYCWI